jgi:hypothetical protein
VKLQSSYGQATRGVCCSIIQPSLYMLVVSLFFTSVQGSEGKVNNIFLITTLYWKTYFDSCICNTVKPLYYVHTGDRKISLYLLTRSLYLTWFVLNKEVHRHRKGPKFSALINEVYLLKRDLLKRFYCMSQS